MQKLLRSVECELDHVCTFTKWKDTPRQLVPWGRWEGPARMLFEIQGQFHVRDLALAREPQRGPCPPQQGMQKRRLPWPMRRQPLTCIQRGSGRRHGQWARPKLVPRIGSACVRRPAPRRAEDGRTVVPPLLGSVLCRLARRGHGKEHPVGGTGGALPAAAHRCRALGPAGAALPSADRQATPTVQPTWAEGAPPPPLAGAMPPVPAPRRGRPTACARPFRRGPHSEDNAGPCGCGARGLAPQSTWPQLAASAAAPAPVRCTLR